MSILVLTSDTLIGTPATGNIEYSGQFYGTDSNASRAQIQRITQGTAVASTSGTSIDFTALPSWVKRITVILDTVSLSGTSQLLLQLGSGSIDTTSYTGSVSNHNGSAGTVFTTGFILTQSLVAAEFRAGLCTICLLGSNKWVESSLLQSTTSTVGDRSAGVKTLGGTLDRLRITSVNGTDTFDAGSINILYEG